MAYVKNTWVDREGTTRYHETVDEDGALIFTPDYEKVTEIGTPVNADNMNHIEEGIEEHETRIVNLENKKEKSGLYTGQTIFSLDPIIDEGVHLLDGSVLSVGGIYDSFITDYITNLYTNYPQRFCTEAEWQQSVTTYGVCGKYVYTEGVSVRLPKVTGHVEGTIDASALGDIVEAGLPNITGSFLGESSAETGAFYKNGEIQAGNTAVGSSVDDQIILFDASRSNPIYKDGVNTVQTQSILGYMYIVVATTTKTQTEVDIDNIATDLNGKADVDLSNCTKPYIIESYDDGQNWYDLYSDGTALEGGYVEVASNTFNYPITFLLNYIEEPIVVTTVAMKASYSSNTGNAQINSVMMRAGTISNISATEFQIAYIDSSLSKRNMWIARGKTR